MPRKSEKSLSSSPSKSYSFSPPKSHSSPSSQRPFSSAKDYSSSPAKGYSSSPTKRAAVRPYFLEWDTRLDQVLLETQELLNGFYRRGSHKESFRFVDGNPILCLSQGLYRHGTIKQYFQPAVPETLFPPGTQLSDVEPDAWIPTVIVHFFQRPRSDEEPIAENELISRGDLPTKLCHVQGMLLAHERNTFERIKLGYDEVKMGKDVWFVDRDKYTELESYWKQRTGKTVSFAEYCGRRIDGYRPDLVPGPSVVSVEEDDDIVEVFASTKSVVSANEGCF